MVLDNAHREALSAAFGRDPVWEWRSAHGIEL
jgi:hypothetical protein